MPNFSGTFSGKAASQTTFSLNDVPNHQFNLAEITGTQKSSDEKWNDATITYWGIADLTSGRGAQHGYWVNEHAGGDRDFGTFEGEIGTAGNEATLAGKFTFTGGTGKFAGITGGGTYKGRMPSPLEVEMKWEGAYQLAVAKAQAR